METTLETIPQETQAKPNNEDVVSPETSKKMSKTEESYLTKGDKV